MEEQKTEERVCPGCGRKIPAELHFCLYCMTRLTPVEDIDKKHAGIGKRKGIYLISFFLLIGVLSVVIGSAVAHSSGKQENVIAKAVGQVENTGQKKHLVTKDTEHLQTEARVPTESLQPEEAETETEQKKGQEEPETPTVQNTEAGTQQAEDTLQTPVNSQSPAVSEEIAAAPENVSSDAASAAAQTSAGADSAGSKPVNPQKAKPSTEKKDTGTTDTTPEEKKVLLEINWDTVAESVRISLQQKYESLQVLSSLSTYQSDSYTKVGQTTTQALGKDHFCQVYPADSDAEDPNERDTAADWTAYYETSIVNAFSAVLDQNPPPADENRLPAVAVYLDHYEDVADGRAVYFTLCY